MSRHATATKSFVFGDLTCRTFIVGFLVVGSAENFSFLAPKQLNYTLYIRYAVGKPNDICAFRFYYYLFLLSDYLYPPKGAMQQQVDAKSPTIYCEHKNPTWQRVKVLEMCLKSAIMAFPCSSDWLGFSSFHFICITAHMHTLNYAWETHGNI